MERRINNELLKWKNDSNKRPIMLYGISGSGKTYTSLDFGKREYKNTIYFDCFKNLELSYVVDKNTTMDKFIRALSAISLETIFKEETLIIFDNVTEKICTAIKKLFAGVSSYHIIVITNSSSFVKKNKGDNFIVKKLGLVSFSEYLKYMDKEQLVTFIEDSFKNNKPMPFHAMAMELFNDYILTGGYPDAIVSFKENKDYNLLVSIHDKNMKIMKNNLLVLDSLIDIKRGIDVFDNMAIQLLKENKKFLYGLLKPGARAKEYDNVIGFMEDNGLVIKSYKVGELTSPLSKIKDLDSFKLYFNDSGLLYKKMNVGANRLLTNDKLMLVLYENNIVQSLASNGFNIYHYHSGGKASIDLVIQTRTGKIIPMEILGDDFSLKSKSLSLALSKYNLKFAIRFTGDNFKEKNGVKYIPYYAAFCILESF